MTSSPLIAAHTHTPFGDHWTVIEPETGAVCAADFAPLPQVMAALPVALSRAGVEVGEDGEPQRALARWLAGDGDALGQVPVRQAGGPFHQEVWSLIREVPPGTTATYGEIAHLAGRPRAARAVGTACARTAVFPFIPCHRVVSAAGPGRDGGFRAGVREAMLAMESAGMVDVSVGFGR